MQSDGQVKYREGSPGLSEKMLVGNRVMAQLGQCAEIRKRLSKTESMKGLL